MRRLFGNFISVTFTFIKFFFIKLFHWNNFRYKIIQRFSPNVVIELGKKAKLILGRTVRVHSGSKIKVRKGAKCNIGDNVKINYNCIIVCHDNITIGSGTEFGPSVYIYDHDHKFDKEKGVLSNEFNTAPVEIGKNVWIGAGTIILKGTKIGDNSVIGASSVIKGEYPSSSLIIQKRENIIK